MFTESNQDLFTFPKNYVRVIPVNLVGIMGKGLAKDVLDHVYNPELFIEQYQNWCHGNIYTYKINNMTPKPGELHSILVVDITYILVATKDHWRLPSQRKWIVDILLNLYFSHYKDIALPAIGCGLGGLPYKWLREKVKEQFENDEEHNVVLLRPR